MAVFLVNVCKFQGCGQEFGSLNGLIQHIEEMHIMGCDRDISERQTEDDYPAAVPLSSVLRYFSESEQKIDDSCASSYDLSDIDDFVTDEMLSELSSLPDDLSLLDSPSKTPPQSLPVSSAEASEAEDEGSDSDSNDDEGPWVNNSNTSNGGPEEYSPEFIMKYGSKSSGGIGEEKPYACPVPGCRKRYKNVNGIKYHAKNGHRRDGKAYKAYKCYCSKAYKTAQGLKNHSLAHHGCLPANVPSSANALNQLRVTRKVTLSASTMAGLQLVGLKALQALTPAQLARLGSGTAQLVVRPRPKALAVPGKLYQDRLLRTAEQAPMLCDYSDQEASIRPRIVSVDPQKKLRLAVPVNTTPKRQLSISSTMFGPNRFEPETELFPEAFDSVPMDLPPTPTSVGESGDTDFDALFS